MKTYTFLLKKKNAADTCCETAKSRIKKKHLKNHCLGAMQMTRKHFFSAYWLKYKNYLYQCHIFYKKNVENSNLANAPTLRHRCTLGLGWQVDRPDPTVRLNIRADAQRGTTHI